MKRLISLLVICVLMLSVFAGCGTTKEQTKQDASTVTENNATAETAKVEEENVSLNFITWGPYDEAIFAKWNEKHPNIKINFQQINDADQYNTVMKTRIAGGADLDIAAVRAENYEDFAKKGYLLDLTGQEFLSNLTDSSVAAATIDGKVYAATLSMGAEAVWYNKDIFKKLNLEVPTSYDDFLAACEAIKKSGIAPMTQAVKDGWATYELGLGGFMAVVEKEPDFGKKLLTGEVKFTDPLFVDALKKYEDIIKKGYIQEGVTGMDWQAAGKQFATGKAAMYINGSWNSGYLKEQKPAFEVGVFIIPQNEKGGTPIAATVPGFFNSVIKSSCKNTEAAIKFLAFLSDKDGGAQIYFDKTGQTPNVKGVTVSDPISSLWVPIVSGAGASSLRNDLRQGPLDKLFIGMQEMLMGKSTPEQVAKEMQAAQDKIGK